MKRILAILLAVFMLAGCSSTSPSPSETATPTPSASQPTNSATPAPSPSTQPEAGVDANQYINTYLTAEPKTLDPGLAADTYGSAILINTMESLTRLEDHDGQLILSPAGAASWTSNEAGDEWTFVLNENFWQDGKPVTSADYAYALRRIVDPATGAPLSYMLDSILNFEACNTGEKPVDEFGVETPDDKTLVIKLTAPIPYFLDLTYSQVFAPQRQDIVEQFGDKYGSEAQYTMSCGPFIVDTWEHNSKIILAKNEHYWDKEVVQLSNVNYAIMTDESTYYNAFLAGEIDLVTTGKQEWLDRFKGVAETTYNSYPTATLTYSFFNAKDPIFQNANIRKAFMLGIDREDLNEMCFGGLRIPTYGWVCPSISIGDNNFRELAGDPIIEMLDSGIDPKELLLKGMEELNLGSDPSTLKITFSLAGTDDWFRTLGEYLQQAYKETLGINLEISFNEWGIFYDNVQKGNFQIGFMGWGAFFNEPFDVLSLFMSTNNAIMTGWADEQYDALMKEASTTLDDKARFELYKQAEDILIRDQAVANPLATSTINQFVYNYLNDYTRMTFSTKGFKYAYTQGR